MGCAPARAVGWAWSRARGPCRRPGWAARRPPLRPAAPPQPARAAPLPPTGAGAPASGRRPVHGPALRGPWVPPSLRPRPELLRL
eukprot:658992-Lingulodinium_polyedra.AAC.1